MADANDNFRIVLTTAGSDEQADSISKALVERRLAACVSYTQVCSIFRWEGRVSRESERLLFIKTTAERVPELRQAIRELHTYEVPELLAIPVAEGGEEYLAWLASAVTSARG
jgi:periplasmic divalent cation tolerance protein